MFCKLNETKDPPEGECDEERPGTALDKAMTCSPSQQPSDCIVISLTHLSVHRALFQLFCATQQVLSGGNLQKESRWFLAYPPIPISCMCLGFNLRWVLSNKGLLESSELGEEALSSSSTPYAIGVSSKPCSSFFSLWVECTSAIVGRSRPVEAMAWQTLRHRRE